MTLPPLLYIAGYAGCNGWEALTDPNPAAYTYSADYPLVPWRLNWVNVHLDIVTLGLHESVTSSIRRSPILHSQRE